MENPIKMDDLELPPFTETPIYVYISYIHWKWEKEREIQDSEVLGVVGGLKPWIKEKTPWVLAPWKTVRKTGEMFFFKA